MWAVSFPRSAAGAADGGRWSCWSFSRSSWQRRGCTGGPTCASDRRHRAAGPQHRAPDDRRHADARLRPGPGQLERLPVKGWDRHTDFARYRFGEAWSDDVNVEFGHNGCNTRDDILRRDLADLVVRPGTCYAQSGVLHDPYTGESIAVRPRPRHVQRRADRPPGLAVRRLVQGRARMGRRSADATSPTIRATCWPSAHKSTSTRHFATPPPGCRPTRASAASSSPARSRSRRAYQLWVSKNEKQAMARRAGRLLSSAQRDQPESRCQRVGHPHVVRLRRAAGRRVRRRGPPRPAAPPDRPTAATGRRTPRRGPAAHRCDRPPAPGRARPPRRPPRRRAARAAAARAGRSAPSTRPPRRYSPHCSGSGTPAASVRATGSSTRTPRPQQRIEQLDRSGLRADGHIGADGFTAARPGVGQMRRRAPRPRRRAAARVNARRAAQDRVPQLGFRRGHHGVHDDSADTGPPYRSSRPGALMCER